MPRKIEPNQIVFNVDGRRRKVDSNRIVDATVTQIRYATANDGDLITEAITKADPARFPEWIAALTESRDRIDLLIRELRAKIPTQKGRPSTRPRHFDLMVYHAIESVREDGEGIKEICDRIAARQEMDPGTLRARYNRGKKMSDDSEVIQIFGDSQEMLQKMALTKGCLDFFSPAKSNVDKN